MIQLPETSLDMKIMNQIHSALQKRVDEIRVRITDEATRKFETEVRAAVGAVAINLSEYYAIESDQGNLRITVKIGKSI